MQIIVFLLFGELSTIYIALIHGVLMILPALLLSRSGTLYLVDRRQLALLVGIGYLIGIVLGLYIVRMAQSRSQELCI